MTDGRTESGHASVTSVDSLHNIAPPLRHAFEDRRDRDAQLAPGEGSSFEHLATANGVDGERPLFLTSK
jgi:hypothetical protein